MAAHGSVAHVREVARRLQEAVREHARKLAEQAAAPAPAVPGEGSPPPAA